MFQVVLFLCIYFIHIKGAHVKNIVPTNDSLVISSRQNSDLKNQSLIHDINKPLELSCQLISGSGDSNNTIVWKFPMEKDSHRYTIDSIDKDKLILNIPKLHENDSGKYECEVASLNLNKVVNLSIRSSFGNGCGSLFECEKFICISRTYVCDGKVDCGKHNPRDESPEHCGNDPCKGKIPCDNGRCIPTSWCCTSDTPNCTVKVRPSCCPQYNIYYDMTIGREGNFLLNSQQHHATEFSFLQSTFYTIVGFAMIFMSIITILMIAICRVHLQRSLLSTVPHTQRSTFHRRYRQRINVYRDERLNSLELPSLLVAYNINNGVQIVGESSEPPTYSEAVSNFHHREPPPPYSSRLDLNDENQSNERLQNSSDS